MSDLQKCAEGELYPRWYILTVARANDKTHTELERRVVRFNKTAADTMNLFAPTYVELRDKGSKVNRIRKPLACNYIFMRSALPTLRSFRSLYSDYNLIRNRAGEGYLTVSDHDLENFRRVALAYRNNMPCFKPDEVELQKGDKVRILDGPFKGIEGIMVAKKGKDGGKVIISIAGLLAVETVEIAPQYIQVIEFARGSKHIYDKLDSFEPRLRKAIGLRLKKGKLTTEEAAPLDYFLQRFGKVKPDSPKIAARLECLLMAAAALAGRTEEWRLHRDRFLGYLPDVTNSVTRIRLLSLHALATVLTYIN